MLVEPEKAKPVNPSLYNQILQMKVGEKLKLALKGNKEARTILIRDANRLIQRFVLQNPRISDDEVLAVAKNRSLDQELLRKIGEHRVLAAQLSDPPGAGDQSEDAAGHGAAAGQPARPNATCGSLPRARTSRRPWSRRRAGCCSSGTKSWASGWAGEGEDVGA